nr:hypothetical protein [Paracoccaceae bacterium]
MNCLRTAVLPVIVAGALALAPAARPQTIPTGEALALAVEASEAGDWTGAASLAGQTRNPVAADIILWMRLRDGVGGWQEYEGFFARNASWPNLATLRRHAERAMPADLPTEAVLSFFEAESPLTGTGALRFASALAGAGRSDAAEAEILRAWRTLAMTGAEAATIAA